MQLQLEIGVEEELELLNLLDRTNYLSTISHLRRIQSPLSRTQPNFEARDLHATHFGRICPSETPEGSNCGLVKNLGTYLELFQLMFHLKKLLKTI